MVPTIEEPCPNELSENLVVRRMEKEHTREEYECVEMGKHNLGEQMPPKWKRSNGTISYLHLRILCFECPNGIRSIPSAAALVWRFRVRWLGTTRGP